MKVRTGAMQFRLRLFFYLQAMVALAFAGYRSPLAPPPDWAEVEAWQETMTRAEFVRLLESVYAPGDVARGLIEVRDDHAEILLAAAAPDVATLHFAKNAASPTDAPHC